MLPVTAKLPEEVVDKVDDYASKKATTRSDAIRQLVEVGLKAKK